MLTYLKKGVCLKFLLIQYFNFCVKKPFKIPYLMSIGVIETALIFKLVGFPYLRHLKGGGNLAVFFQTFLEES